ncbi:MAG: acyl carrier protein [Paludibacter sp.]|nr:acyl carrier protein [Paludibacter sp.]
MELEDKFKTIISEVFKIPKEEIILSTRQNELKGWSSLGQLKLIMQIETYFNVSFSIDQIVKMDNFELILDELKKKLSDKNGE